MRPKKKEEKLVIRFDSEARREYLTGFSKRKRLRKAKAKLDKAKLEQEQRKKLKVEKKEELKKKLGRYGLGEEKVDVMDQSEALQDNHPNHVVVINTSPEFGLSLSAMVEEEKEDWDSNSVKPINSHKSNHRKHKVNF